MVVWRGGGGENRWGQRDYQTRISRSKLWELVFVRILQRRAVPGPRTFHSTSGMSSTGCAMASSYTARARSASPSDRSRSANLRQVYEEAGGYQARHGCAR